LRCPHHGILPGEASCPERVDRLSAEVIAGDYADPRIKAWRERFA